MISVLIICDTCGVEWVPPLDKRHLTGLQLRIEARSDRWVCSSKNDTCPNCRPKKKDGTIYKKYEKWKQLAQ